MSAYPLEILLGVYSKRADREEKKLKQARARVATCREELNARKQALADYQAWCEREAERIFGLIEKTTVPHWRVMSAREEIAWNAARTAVYRQAIIKAEEDLADAEKEEERCLAELQIRNRELLKIQNHRKLWCQQELEQSEAAEELLIDENATTIFLYHRSK